MSYSPDLVRRGLHDSTSSAEDEQLVELDVKTLRRTPEKSGSNQATPERELRSRKSSVRPSITPESPKARHLRKKRTTGNTSGCDDSINWWSTYAYETKSLLGVFAVIFALFAVILFAGVYGVKMGNFNLNSFFTRQDSSPYGPIFEKKLNNLKNLFVSQPTHNWRIIRAAFSGIVNSSSLGANEGPGVLIVLANKRDHHIASCFAYKLGIGLVQTFDDKASPQVVHGGRLNSQSDPADAKHELDEICRDALNEKKGRALIVTHLEQVHSSSASILHSYCDQDASPYKKNAFIFTVHTHEEVDQGVERRQYDTIAERVLDLSWADLDENKRSALIARLTGNVILLSREPNRVC